jgi:3-isopropylmalate dehydrogenase
MDAQIAVLKGDDIGPDIVAATVRVLDAALRKHGLDVEWVELPAGVSALAEHRSTLPEMTVERLAEIPGWILGPVGHQLYPLGDSRYVNPSGFLRKSFELYANVRPSRALEGVNNVRSDLDLVIVRENTEGFYADRNVLDGNGELRPDEDTVISVRVVTRRACLRVARQAFELAVERDRLRKVTAVHKANILRRGDGLFLDACRTVARDYPGIELDEFLVDAFAMRLVMRPAEHDVVVTTNMFGDILSDEAAGLTGGLGLAPGLNVGDEHAMAQAVHGSAPDITGRGIANPIAEILSGALLLGWLARKLEQPAFSAARVTVETAVGAALRRGEHLTPDLGGGGNTERLTDAIVAELDATRLDKEALS